jgi:hypothetical protein
MPITDAEATVRSSNAGPGDAGDVLSIAGAGASGVCSASGAASDAGDVAETWGRTVDTGSVVRPTAGAGWVVALFVLVGTGAGSAASTGAGGVATIRACGGAGGASVVAATAASVGGTTEALTAM